MNISKGEFYQLGSSDSSDVLNDIVKLCPEIKESDTKKEIIVNVEGTISFHKEDESSRGYIIDLRRKDNIVKIIKITGEKNE